MMPSQEPLCMGPRLNFPVPQYRYCMKISPFPSSVAIEAYKVVNILLDLLFLNPETSCDYTDNIYSTTDVLHLSKIQINTHSTNSTNFAHLPSSAATPLQ